MSRLPETAAGSLHPSTSAECKVQSSGYFERNLSRLSAKQPELAALLSVTPNCRVKVFPSASGTPTAAWETGGSSLPLHSRYDPVKEARHKLMRQKYEGADYFILLGFGLGYLLDALLEKVDATSNHYFIIESDPEILRAAFEARDLASILSLPNIHFAWPVCGPELAEQWRRFFDPVHAQQSTYLTHLPSLALHRDLFKAAAELIQSQTFQIFTDINTLVAKSEIFLDNFVQNFPKAAKAPGVSKFASLFSGVPALIVSAGPSLDKNIHELRGFENNILILSTDTALKPLLAAGIDPHFVLTGDPSHTNYLHLKGAASRESLLVAETTSFPGAFDDFEGRVIACTFENSSMRSLSDLLGNKGTIRAWGSVATMALDFALLLGCDPIAFIGQDLAHTGGRLYCSGVFFDEEWFAGIDDPQKWQIRLQDLRSGRRTIMIDDIHGKPVESTDKLSSYWNWILRVFRDHPETRFINATEGGILRGPAGIISLKETLNRYCRVNLHLRATVGRFFEEARQNSLLYSHVNLSTLTGEIMKLQETLRFGLQVCTGRPICPVQDLAKILEQTKQSIYRNTHLAPLLDCFNQMGNVSFLRRQRALFQMGAPQSSEIKDLYSDYFCSVGESLAKIQRALSQIEREADRQASPPVPHVSPATTQTAIPESFY